LFLVAALGALGWAGCAGRGVGPGGEALTTGAGTPGIGTLAGVTGAAGSTFPTGGTVSTADVAFRLISPASGREDPHAAIRAVVGDPTVTCSLKILDLGNTARPVTLMSRTVPVIGGVATATFRNIPLRTIIGAIEIQNGFWQGKSSYRGAADLIPGSNTIDLVASGSLVKQDIVADLLEYLVAQQASQARLFPRLAAEAATIYDHLLQAGQVSYANARQVFSSQSVNYLGQITVCVNCLAPANTVLSSVREGPAGSIRVAVGSRRFSARVTANPGRGNQTATVTTDVSVASDGRTIHFCGVKVEAPVGPQELAVELFPASFTGTTDPLYKGYSVQTALPPTEPATLAAMVITPASTAEALAYDRWKGKAETYNQTIADFQDKKPDIATLTAVVESQLSSTLTSAEGPAETFKWPASVTAEVVTVASVTPVVARRGRIDGTLTDDITGAPIPGALIGLAGTTIFAVTDANGFFEILDLAPGTYDLVIQRDGYAPRTVPDIVVTADPSLSRPPVRLTARRTD